MPLPSLYIAFIYYESQRTYTSISRIGKW